VLKTSRKAASGRRWIHDHKLVVNVKKLNENFAGRPWTKEEEVTHLDELVDEVEDIRERVRGRPHTLRRRNACIFSVMDPGPDPL
jgi:hypothetical protein